MTDWKTEWKYFGLLVGVFLLFFFIPFEQPRWSGAILEGFHLAQWYAREHVIFCLIPAFFIAGAVSVFISKEAVMKYLGAAANKVLAYGVASVSGTILAVCSCTVLPLFAGIYRMGAGLGPATAFLYSGPAINILAIALTARVLGPEMGIARAIGAIVFSVVIGMAMHLIFRKEEEEKAKAQAQMPEAEVSRPLWQNAVYFAALIAILVFANWGQPEEIAGFWSLIHSVKWQLTAIAGALLAVILSLWFKVHWWKTGLLAAAVALASFLAPGFPLVPFAVGVVGLSIVTITGLADHKEWFESSWGFAKQILPLLLFGVLVAGALLGRPGNEGLIPSEWIAAAVGGNSIWSNLLASVLGAFMYFATLTEVPILQGLIGNGMGKGPALALLLAGPALSLPNMLVIRSIMGTKKTLVFVLLVVIMATISGIIFGAIT